jgi:hypothetical protein
MLVLVSSTAPPRLHFRRGVAAEHVQGNTYRWVDPIEGTHKGYVVALSIEYEPTIDAQISRSKRQ